MSKVGNTQIRKALYMPAIVAKSNNPMVSEFCKRLTQKRKVTMVVIAAAMRKFLHIIFGVLKNQNHSLFFLNRLDEQDGIFYATTLSLCTPAIWCIKDYIKKDVRETSVLFPFEHQSSKF